MTQMLCINTEQESTGDLHFYIAVLSAENKIYSNAL
jgi:hypothetical protein